MSTFHFNGDALLASRIDIARAARALRKHLAGVADELGIPESARSPLRLDQGQGLDVLCKILGAQSHHAARMTASDPDITGWSQAERQELINQMAVSRGYGFAGGLPPALGPAWQKQAMGLVREAIANNRPGNGELIALVGRGGAGKTVLANAMAHKWEGTVIDISLRSPSLVPESRKLGSVLIFDAPSDRAPRKGGNAHHAVMLEWQLARTASELISAQRRLFDWQAGLQSATNRVVDAVAKRPDQEFVMSFPSVAAVEAFMVDYRALARDANVVANWTLAHVIDLDAMQYTVLRAGATASMGGRNPAKA